MTLAPWLATLALFACASFPPPPASSPVPADIRQLVVVVTPSWDATSGELRRYVREGGGWRAVGPQVEVVVGRSGLGWGRGLHEAGAPGPTKAEGDGRAPAGVFRLTAAFGYADGVATGLPYVASTPSVQCVDDVRSRYYNLVLDSTAIGPDADWRSQEHMRRDDGLYRIGVVVAHNGPGVAETGGGDRPAGSAAAIQPGGGSCIFLHVWRGPGSTTAGCTAMADPALESVLAWLDADAAPVLVQLPAEVYRQQAGPWGLPAWM